MKFSRIVLLMFIARAVGESLKDSIKTLEHLLVSFETSLTVDAFVCWELGERISSSVDYH